ncbi:type II secretion system protein [Providencia rettgeri]
MIKIKNIGFSLIELLITLGIISALSIAAIFIYNKVSVSQKVKDISEDMKYSVSEYRRLTSIYSAASFSVKNGCCEMSPVIFSNFPLISEKPAFEGNTARGEATKTYNGPYGNNIEIAASENQNTNYGDGSKLTYSIVGVIDEEVCIKLVMNNINSASYVSVWDLYSKNGGLIHGINTNKLSLPILINECKKLKNKNSRIKFTFHSAD